MRQLASCKTLENSPGAANFGPGKQHTPSRDVERRSWQRPVPDWYRRRTTGPATASPAQALPSSPEPLPAQSSVMSASYNPLQTEDQQIEADAAYARRLQAEERRSATTQSPLHDVSEISRNHAAAPQFPKIPSPAKLVEGLSREQTAGAVFAAFVAVKLGLGPAFAQLTCVALGLAVFRVARKVANLDDEGAFRAAFSAAFVLAFIVACVGVTAADVCALLALSLIHI